MERLCSWHAFHSIKVLFFHMLVYQCRPFLVSQWDIRGNAHGILAAHPITPFISIHHVEAVEPLYSGLSHLESLKLFTKASRVNPRSFLQRAIGYDRDERITFAVSLGYVVQVFPNIVLPRELERSELTFTAWNRIANRFEFDLDTKDPLKSVCKKSIKFFLRNIFEDGSVSVSTYFRSNQGDDLKRKVFCFPQSPTLSHVDEIRILGNPLSDNWHLVCSFSLLILTSSLSLSLFHKLMNLINCQLGAKASMLQS